MAVKEPMLMNWSLVVEALTMTTNGDLGNQPIVVIEEAMARREAVLILGILFEMKWLLIHLLTNSFTLVSIFEKISSSRG